MNEGAVPPSVTPTPGRVDATGPDAAVGHTTPIGPAARRLPGPDVVRAIAMAGVVIMNYHGYFVINAAAPRPTDPSWLDSLFDPWEGPLSTRFAATFVLTAGVGVALMSRRARTDRSLASDLSWRFVRRGVVLYLFGLAFNLLWPGTILPYYGAMFVLAAGLWRLPSWVLAAVGTASAFGAWLLHEWVIGTLEAGGDVTWLVAPRTYSPSGLLFNVFVNGTHPLLPWLAFFCAGMILGRSLLDIDRLKVTFAVATTMWLVATAIGLAAASSTAYSVLLSSHPFDRGIVYTTSALGTALMAFLAINAAANRYADSALVEALRRAGQLSLTIYVGHALVFELLVKRLDLIRPTPAVGPALIFALTYWAVATALATAFQRRFGRGPAEWVYRKITWS